MLQILIQKSYSLQNLLHNTSPKPSHLREDSRPPMYLPSCSLTANHLFSPPYLPSQKSSWICNIHDSLPIVTTTDQKTGPGWFQPFTPCLKVPGKMMLHTTPNFQNSIGKGAPTFKKSVLCNLTLQPPQNHVRILPVCPESQTNLSLLLLSTNHLIFISL